LIVTPIKSVKNIFMKKVLMLSLVGCLIVYSCNKKSVDETKTSNSIAATESVSTERLSSQLEKSDDFKKYVDNLKKIKELAFLSAKENSFIKTKSTNYTSFLEASGVSENSDIISIKAALGSQFSENEQMTNILAENITLVSNLRNKFTQISSLDASALQNEFEIAFDKIDPSHVPGGGTGPGDKCKRACERQYYISAGACALLVETIFGAVICFIAACAGLDSCLGGCI
jgi:hypothetical protein